MTSQRPMETSVVVFRNLCEWKWIDHCQSVSTASEQVNESRVYSLSASLFVPLKQQNKTGENKCQE